MRSPLETAAGTSAAPTARDGRMALVRAAIAAHGDRLAAYPGVLSVRPGYRFRAGRLTSEPAISVSVLRKRAPGTLDPRALLPPEVEGIPVDVVPAGAAEQLRAAWAARPELASAADAARAVAETSERRGVVDPRTPLDADDEPAAVAEAAPRREYPEPDRMPTAVEEEMTLVCHASPDAGWRLLREFLAGTGERLAATMFEFTAEHVLEGLLAALAPPRSLRLVMDYEREPHGLDNLQVQRTLAAALGDRLTFAWAPVASDNVTTVGYFPTSYHIKVAVRDGAAFWLSSGNFKPSSQPEADPFSPPAGFDAHRFQREHNREWHLIVESRGLAEQLEHFIEHDLAESRKVQASGAPLPAPALPDFLVPAAPAGAPPPSPAPPVFFRERVLKKKMRVMPLLTPRHFVEHVLPLVEGARRRIWFQNQSLKPAASRPEYMRLFDALGAQSRRPELDTRIIVRGDFDPHRVLMALQEAGYEMPRVRLQSGCHTKGLIIDDEILVLGSHNWTGQGATENRDASLIVHDADAVAYFAQLFEHDWDHLATDRIGADEILAIPAPAGGGVPAGMRRISWRDLAD